MEQAIKITRRWKDKENFIPEILWILAFKG